MSERLKVGMNEMMHRVVAQTEQKALWQGHDNAEIIARFLAEEVRELAQSLEETAVTGDVFNVVSEIGDILYLALKFCHEAGINPQDAVELKILRNDLKYPNDLNSHGDYNEQRIKSKSMWEAMGGDVAFSHAYLDVFSRDDIVEDDVIEEKSPPHVPRELQVIPQTFPQELTLVHSNGNGHNGHH